MDTLGRFALGALAGIAALGWLLAFTTLANAQHNHAQGHNIYQGWSSQKTSNCCNNDDCGDLLDDEWRETATGTEIKVLDQWCPVLQEHYITKGKSPDWTKAHACVNKNINFSPASVCDRLLCFSGLPKG